MAWIEAAKTSKIWLRSGPVIWPYWEEQEHMMFKQEPIQSWSDLVNGEETNQGLNPMDLTCQNLLQLV